MDKECAHAVMFAANLEFAIWDIDSVLALARVVLEEESFFTGIDVEGVSDLCVFVKERVLFQCFKVALTLTGFLGFISDEVGFIQDMAILDVLFISKT